MDMKERFSQTATVDVPADGVARSFTIPEPENISATYFLRLRLLSLNGQILSRNFYWLSAKPDVLEWEKTEWFFTPMTGYADYSALETLPKVALRSTLRVQPAGEEETGHVTLDNPSKTLAFLVRLRILRGKGGEEVLPVFWEDNYFSLLPGEKRSVAVRYSRKDLGGAKPALAIDGWNISPATVQ